MAIEWDPDARQWHLRTDHISLVLAIRESGELGQLYLGSPLAPGTDYRHLARGPFPAWDNRLGESVRLELPTPDTGDYRQPALDVVFADGSRATHMCYIGHRIIPGKPDLPGLPALTRTARPLLLDPTGVLSAGAWADRVDRVAFPGLDTALLLRPDCYVAWQGTSADGLDDALTRWFGRP